MAQPFIFPEYTLADVEKNCAHLAKIFQQFGVIIMPNLFTENEFFQHYLDDLKRLTKVLYQKVNMDFNENSNFDDLISTLAKVDQSLPKYLADMGTQPNKLISANLLKYQPEILSLITAILGQDAIFATPAAGDTLHFFIHGEFFQRYNLPIHQDYPRLMQSLDQITLFFSLNHQHEEVGGLYYWPESHQEGLMPIKNNDKNYYEVVLNDEILNKYQRHEMRLGFGDVAIFHSLLWHQTIANTSAEHSRIVQLFRYANINNEMAHNTFWQSTTYPRPSLEFIKIFPDLFHD